MQLMRKRDVPREPAAATHQGWMAFPIVVGFLVWLFALLGFMFNSPNQARVVQLFGAYVGTLRDTGFFYGNPFYWRTRVSLRVRTFETGMTETKEVKEATTGRVLSPATSSRKPSKVNDLNGTPIEIAAVVVWKVFNSAEAAFQVENITMAYVFYRSGLSINVMYTIDDPKKRAVGFKLSDGMDVPEELSQFKFARQKSRLAGTIRGSYFVIKNEH